MKPITIKYLGNLRTEATHPLSGEKLITDAPPDNNGKGEAFSPTDLLATAIGSCMLTIMGITGNTSGIDISGSKVSVEKIMASNPRRIGELKVYIELPRKLNSKEKTILERSAKHCPVAKSIHPDIKENISFSYTI
jgi:putative redox protein